MKNYIIIFCLIAISGYPPKGKEKLITRLFNGYSLEGWHMDVPALDTSDVSSPFIVRDSLLVSLGIPQGHLITDSIYKDYQLELEYRFPKEPGNCGVLVHVSDSRALYDMFPKSIEIQLKHENAGDFWCIQQDIAVNNMEERRGKKSNWGISEGKERRIINLTDGSEKPLGEWNYFKAQCKKDSIRVWINDVLVNEGFGCTATEGQIAIQAEGAEVEFKNIIHTKLKSNR